MTYKIHQRYGMSVMRPSGGAITGRFSSGLAGTKPSLVIMDELETDVPGTIRRVRMPRGRRGKKKNRWVLTLRDGSTRKYTSPEDAEAARVLRGL